jgi:hypothetical protein
MKDNLLQILTAVSIVATIVVNILANALPINGQNTGEIADRFKIYFVPDGYVFSIWGVIYIGLIALAVFQALPSQGENPRMRTTGWWIVLGSLANIAWIFLWHYEQFPLTLIAMLALLATLIVTYLRLGIGQTKVSKGETWAVRLPISVYLGWITVATVANATQLLDFFKWNRFGIPAEVWTWIVLSAVLVIAVLMNFSRRDIGFTAVILWALAGISIKHAEVPAVAIASWITFGLVALSMLVAFVSPRRLFTKEPVH